MDKIIWLPDERTISNPQGGFSLTIPHELGAIPFVKGTWSSDSWDTTWPTNITVNDIQQIAKQVAVESDETNVYVHGLANVTSFVLRLWGVFHEATTLDVVVAPTRDKSANKFVLNSDFNYPKLYLDNFADATSGQVSVPHNLGFVPQVDAWQRIEVSSGVYRWVELNNDILGTSSIANSIMNVSSSEVSFATGSGYFYCRIYADEA
ncbi:MAG: hypothetical protein ACK5MU_03990 [Candidatus Saccharimonadales bacterium]